MNALLFRFALCLGFVSCNASGGPEESPALSSSITTTERVWRPEYQTTEELTGRDYWFYEASGLLENVEESDEMITGNIADRHGLRPFEIATADASDPWARADGTKLAIQRLLAIGRQADDSANTDEIVQRLMTLTEEDFSDLTQWQTWFTENQDFLFWSDEIGHLIVEEQAKKNGVSAKQFLSRRTDQR